MMNNNFRDWVLQCSSSLTVSVPILLWAKFIWRTLVHTIEPLDTFYNHDRLWHRCRAHHHERTHTHAFDVFKTRRAAQNTCTCHSIYDVCEVMKTHKSLIFFVCRLLFIYFSEPNAFYVPSWCCLHFHTVLVHGIRIHFISSVRTVQGCRAHFDASNRRHLHAIKPPFEFNDDISDQRQIKKKYDETNECVLQLIFSIKLLKHLSN